MRAGFVTVFSVSSLPYWYTASTLQCLLEQVHKQHMAACYCNELMKGESAAFLNGVCNLILDVMDPFCTNDLEVTLYL